MTITEDLRDVIGYLAVDHQIHVNSGSRSRSGSGSGSGSGSIMDDIDDALARHHSLSEELVHLQRTCNALLQRGQGGGWGWGGRNGGSGGNGSGRGDHAGGIRFVGNSFHANSNVNNTNVVIDNNDDNNDDHDIVSWEVVMARECIEEKELQLQAVVNELDAVYQGLVLEVGHHHQHHRRAKEKLYPLGKLLYLNSQQPCQSTLTTSSSTNGGDRDRGSGRGGVVLDTSAVNEGGMLGGRLRGLNLSGRGDEGDNGGMETMGGEMRGERERISSSSSRNEQEQEYMHENRTNVGGVLGGNGVMIYEVDQLSFDHLVLSTDMLSAHLNNAYKGVIDTITITTTTTTSTSS